jgi:hypothetical protein
MDRAIERVVSWFTDHPHTLVSLAIGICVGVLMKIPTGWVLPEAGSLVGAACGALAAVGSALWAANAKQRKEDARADTQQRQIASMIAAAIVPEIVNAHRNFITVANHLDAAIQDADRTGDIDAVCALLNESRLGSDMCERYMGQLHAFGKDATVVVEAVGAILDIQVSNKALVAPVRNFGWNATREMVVIRTRFARAYSDNFTNTIRVLAEYHPRSEEVLGWLNWTPRS